MFHNTFDAWRALTPEQRWQHFGRVAGASAARLRYGSLREEASEMACWLASAQGSSPLSGLPLAGHEALPDRASLLPGGSAESLGLWTVCQSRWPGCEGVVETLSCGLAPLGVGPDCLGWLRLAAGGTGMYAFRMPGLGGEDPGGCGVARYGGLGWITTQAGDLIEVGRALAGGAFLNGAVSARILDASLAMPDGPGGGLARAGVEGLAACGAVEDPELMACLLHALHGSLQAWEVLASREAHEGAYPAPADKGREWQAWELRGVRCSRQELEAAHRVEAAVVAGFQQLFESYDAVLLPLLCLGEAKGWHTFAAAVSLARLPAMVIPVSRTDGSSTALQIVFPDAERLAGMTLTLPGMRT